MADPAKDTPAGTLLEVDPGYSDFMRLPVGPIVGADVETMTAYLVAPPYMILLSTTSDLGPVRIPSGQTHVFRIHYQIAPTAPQGCFRAFIKLRSPDPIVPDIEDLFAPMDFDVLPSTGTRGRFWAKLRARIDCRKRLDSAEIPNRRAKCFHSIVDALSRVQASTQPARPLYFEDDERDLRNRPLASVIREASGGSIPAVLELGYRKDSDSRRALLDLEKGPNAEKILVSFEEHPFQCETLLASRISDFAKLIPAARQALARLGDESRFDFFVRDLDSEDPDAALRAVAALAYVGDNKSSAALGRLLLRGDRSDGRWFGVTYAAVGALGRLHPEEARRIKAQSSGPDEELLRWREWAKPGAPR